MKTSTSPITEPLFPCSVKPGTVKKPWRFGAVLISLLTGAVLAATSPHAFASKPGSAAVQFEITGVGKGAFANAVIAPTPGKADGQSSGLCVTLEGGSRHNTPALLTWLGSNDAGAALATKPDATLTVSANRHGLRKGVYHLTQVTVADYIKKADSDLTHVRVDTIKVTCGTLQEPSA